MKPTMDFSFKRECNLERCPVDFYQGDVFCLSASGTLASLLNMRTISVKFTKDSKDSKDLKDLKDFLIEFSPPFFDRESRIVDIFNTFKNKDKAYELVCSGGYYSSYTIDYRNVFKLKPDEKRQMLSDFLDSMLEHLTLSQEEIVNPLLEFLKEKGYEIQLTGAKKGSQPRSPSVASSSGFFSLEDENDSRASSSALSSGEVLGVRAGQFGAYTEL